MPESALTQNRSPRRALLRFGIFVGILTTTALVIQLSPLKELFDRDQMVALVEQIRGTWWAPLALVAAYVVLCPLGMPATPIIFAGGAVFGIALGGTLNFVGILLGAITSYGLARALGRDFVVHLLGESRMSAVEALLRKHGFWALVGARYVPVPFPVTNFTCALAGVSLRDFISSSALGLLPASFIYTYFVDSMFHAATGELGWEVIRNVLLAVGLSLLLVIIPPTVKWWLGRRRARQPG